jgi:hypothetical protein
MLSSVKSSGSSGTSTVLFIGEFVAAGVLAGGLLLFPPLSEAEGVLLLPLLSGVLPGVLLGVLLGVLPPPPQADKRDTKSKSTNPRVMTFFIFLTSSYICRYDFVVAIACFLRLLYNEKTYATTVIFIKTLSVIEVPDFEKGRISEHFCLDIRPFWVDTRHRYCSLF